MTNTYNAPPSSSQTRKERVRVVAGTTIGTAIEWYDYFLYAGVAGLVFNQIMFSDQMDPGVATVISFLTVGISFIFRPLGAFLAGYFSDRVGRRLVLQVTLVSMGLATALIGLLPTFETIGIWAPILLMLLRVIQGISAGGEWGSAVLLAVEHAPNNKRGLFGAGPQTGVPLGLLASSAILALMNVIAPGDAFMEWGWRVPFLLSILLVFVGMYIRHGVEESPVYEEMTERPDVEPVKNPIGTLFSRFSPVLIVAALVLAANGAVGYMTTGGFVQSYATDPNGLAMDRGQVLLAVTASAVGWLITTAFAGWISDKIGRKRTYLIGGILQAAGVLALFPAINTGDIWILASGLLSLTIGLGLTYGEIASMFVELYPASIRGSGASITYAVASILGGAFAPMIAQALVNATGGTAAVTGYLLAMTVIGFIAMCLLRDRTGIPLGDKWEKQQSTGHFIWQKPSEAIPAEASSPREPIVASDPS